MDTGATKLQEDRVYVEAVALLIATLQQNRRFFAARIPDIYWQLCRLVQGCRRHRRLGNQVASLDLLHDELFRLFGVRVVVPPGRQLSVLAGVIRHVVVEYARMQRQLAKGGIQVLVQEIRRQLPAVSEVDVLLVDDLLERLTEQNAAAACLVELRYFARLGRRDIAVELGVATDLVERELRLTKAWLIARVQAGHAH